MRVDARCPKCFGLARYDMEHRTVELRCRCGYRQVVYAVKANGMIEQHTLPTKSVRLPKEGTKLAECLARVSLHGKLGVSTGAIAFEMNQSTTETSAQLVVLMHKGLVDKIDSKRGQFGGSDWRVTHRALRLMKGEQ
jgi:hypothetical protein